MTERRISVTETDAQVIIERQRDRLKSWELWAGEALAAEVTRLGNTIRHAPHLSPAQRRQIAARLRDALAELGAVSEKEPDVGFPAE